MNYASVYAVFSLFFANFQQLITAFSNGVTFRFGQLYHSSREQFERAFEWYESLYYMFVFWVYTVITAFLMPIRILVYSSGKTMRKEMNRESREIFSQISARMMNDATGTDLMAST